MLKDRFGHEYNNKDVKKKRKKLKPHKQLIDSFDNILSKFDKFSGTVEDLLELKNYKEVGRVFIAIERIAEDLAKLKRELLDEIYDTEVYTIVERVYITRAGIGGS